MEPNLSKASYITNIPQYAPSRYTKQPNQPATRNNTGDNGKTAVFISLAMLVLFAVCITFITLYIDTGLEAEDTVMTQPDEDMITDRPVLCWQDPDNSTIVVNCNFYNRDSYIRPFADKTSPQFVEKEAEFCERVAATLIGTMYESRLLHCSVIEMSSYKLDFIKIDARIILRLPGKDKATVDYQRYQFMNTLSCSLYRNGAYYREPVLADGGFALCEESCALQEGGYYTCHCSQGFTNSLHRECNQRRGEHVLSTFLAEKIDYQVFLETPPEQLEELVPAYGDRLALSNKARRMADSSCNSRETASTSMLARLKRKNAEHPGTSKKSLNMKGNRIAVKKDLRFELGLMKYTGNPSNPFKQVRSSQGGGTRHLTADRNTKIGEIHEIAQNLFFPEGYSRPGYLKNFSTTMRDVNGIEIPCSSSIQEQYHERKVKMLRMYLFIKTNAVPNEVPEAQQSDERTEGLSNLEPALPDFPVHENNGLDDEKEKSVSVDGDVNFEQFDNGGLEGRPSMYDHPLSLDDNQSTLAEQPFPFDDDPPTLADQPLPLDDHSLIGEAQPLEEQSLKIKLHRGHVFEELNEAFQNNPAMKWLFGSSC